MYLQLWNSLKTVEGDRIIASNAYLERERHQINHLTTFKGTRKN